MRRIALLKRHHRQSGQCCHTSATPSALQFPEGHAEWRQRGWEAFGSGRKKKKSEIRNISPFFFFPSKLKKRIPPPPPPRRPLQTPHWLRHSDWPWVICSALVPLSYCALSLSKIITTTAWLWRPNYLWNYSDSVPSHRAGPVPARAQGDGCVKCNLFPEHKNKSSLKTWTISWETGGGGGAIIVIRRV